MAERRRLTADYFRQRSAVSGQPSHQVTDFRETVRVTLT